MRTFLCTEAVAHHEGLACGVGIVADIFVGIDDVDSIDVLNATEVEVGTGRHAAGVGLRVVIGDNSGVAIKDHARATRDGGGVRAVVALVEVGG